MLKASSEVGIEAESLAQVKGPEAIDDSWTWNGFNRIAQGTKNTQSINHSTHHSGDSGLVSHADNIPEGGLAAKLDKKPSLPTSAHPSRQNSLKRKQAKVKEAKSNSTWSPPKPTSRTSQRDMSLKTQQESEVLPPDFGSDPTQRIGNFVQGRSSDGNMGPTTETRPSQFSVGRDEEGRKTYQCRSCPKICTRNLGDMKRHLHSLCHQDPAYCCVPECGKVFTRPDALVRHIRTKHKKEADNIIVDGEKAIFKGR